jgi:hypothetical protein
MTVLLALLVSGCATSGSGDSPEPCVKQDRCVIGCIARENKCVYPEKPDGA